MFVHGLVQAQARQGTVGRAWPSAEVKIFNDEGEELKTGEVGTIYMLLSENMRFEYKGDKAKTQKERLGDYFTVGDVGYLNEEGYLFLSDRKIDMIISGGANIYPAEIESELILHDKAKILILTRANLPWIKGMPEGEFLAEFAKLNGVNENQIVLTRQVQNTDDEAKAVVEVLPPDKNIILVDDDKHIG